MICLKQVLNKITISQHHQRFISSGLILAKQKDGILSRDTLCAIGALNTIPNLSVFLCGKKNELALCHDQLAKISCINTIYESTYDHIHDVNNENITTILHKLQQQKQFNYICGIHSTNSKSILPRLSALLDVNMISNVIHIDFENNLFTQSVYANNINKIMKNNYPTKIFTLRTSSFLPVCLENKNQYTQNIISLEPICKNANIQCTYIQVNQSKRPDYSVSPVILVGGRGVGSKQGFESLYTLADCLHGNVGGTRGAVDSGYISNSCQIGQTGKYVSPYVYIGFGVSGAVQHLAGIKDSGTIMAINKDSQANIFKICDYGFVGDLHTCIPEIIKLLK